MAARWCDGGQAATEHYLRERAYGKRELRRVDLQACRTLFIRNLVRRNAGDRIRGSAVRDRALGDVDKLHGVHIRLRYALNQLPRLALERGAAPRSD